LTIRHAIEEGASEYDMLHGEEEYKFHWASNVRHLIRLDLHPPNGRGLLCRGARTVRNVAVKVTRRMVPGPIVEWMRIYVKAGTRKD
jgi:CelD/BcsL family acetyltransferase involved in cellulose biosynthesis